MVAEPWHDSAFLEATPLEEEDEDLWHVAVEPDDVKVLTLDQLDDLFRLDIVDGSTRVWQPGMSDWLPLSIVAGFEDEKAPAQPAPAPRRPAAVGGLSTPFANGPAPNAFAVDSLRPVVSSPSYPAPATSGGGRAASWLLGLAAVAGLSLVLYRNGVVKDVALASGQQSTFSSLESVLGGPSFGTVRSIEQLSASLGLEDVKVPNALLIEEIASKDAEKAAAGVGAEQSGSVGEAKEQAAATKGEDPEGKTESGSETSTVSLDALPKEKEGFVDTFEQRMSGKAAKPKAVPRSSKTGSSKRGSGKNTGYSKDLGFKGSSNEYDPLNPTL